MDALLLTLLNGAACLLLPKLLSKIVAAKPQLTSSVVTATTDIKNKIAPTSFPYCTTYVVTGNQFCKFRPQFCSKCSPR
jgi:hypothetical protein